VHRIIKIGALAAITVLAVGVVTANAGTTSTAPDCKPVKAHTEYKWVPDVTNAGPTQWTTDNPPANTSRSFPWKGQQVAYHRDGTKSQFIDSVTCQVSAPMFNINVETCSVTVPYTPGIDTVLYGVNGHTETPITGDVTVTGSRDGAPDTAGQFWIGYKAQPGYVIATPNAAPTHIDFYNGDYVRDCVSSATGDVTWDFNGGLVTGTVKFDASQTGGSLRYTNSNGMWLEGVVTSYRQIDDHTAVFAGTITGGSSDYTDYTDPDYFFAKVVDGGSTGDQVAVLANEGPTDASGDYDMSLGSGIVTHGNLVVH